MNCILRIAVRSTCLHGFLALRCPVKMDILKRCSISNSYACMSTVIQHEDVNWNLNSSTKPLTKLLTLTGPTNSDKAALLRKVLPEMLAAQHAVEGGTKPVFWHFTITLGEGPEAALTTSAVKLPVSPSRLASAFLSCPPPPRKR